MLRATGVTVVIDREGMGWVRHSEMRRYCGTINVHGMIQRAQVARTPFCRIKAECRSLIKYIASFVLLILTAQCTTCDESRYMIPRLSYSRILSLWFVDLLVV